MISGQRLQFGAVGLSLGIVLVFIASMPTADAADYCPNCGSTYKPVCGMDGQTYGNPCVLGCAQVPKAYDGKCDSRCYPYGDGDCDSYNWDSTEPICAHGLTFTNLAEAACSGTPKTIIPKCYQKGVCKYNVRGGKVYSQYVTPKGRPGTVKAAASNTKAPPRSGARYSYSEALTKSLIFFDSQISGKFQDRGARRLTWRRNSCRECVDKKYNKDLSGGFYEAGGSYIKFPLINSYMGGMLGWAGLEQKAALVKSGNWADLRFKVKWIAEYLIACEVAPFTYAAIQGISNLDFDYYGPPELYFKYVTANRPVGYITKTNRGSEVLADAAATLAITSMLLVDVPDKTFAPKARTTAERLYKWAKDFPGSYENNKDKVTQNLKDLYSSNGYNDEMAWAAYWLFRATKKTAYLADAKAFYAKTKFNPTSDTFELNNRRPALSVLLSRNDYAKYSGDAAAYFNAYLTQKVPHTARGLAYPYSWGAIRHGPNVAFLGFMHAKNAKVPVAYKNRLLNYGMFQVNYVLGDSGRSWMVGFGKAVNWYLWHKPSYNSILKYDAGNLTEKIWAMPDPGPWASEKVGKPGGAFIPKAKLDMESSRIPQRHVAYGHLVSPLFNDNLVASRRDYKYMEHTLEYNVGFTAATIFLAGYYNQGPYTGAMKEVLP